jgi:hypothetical protein
LVLEICFDTIDRCSVFARLDASFTLESDASGMAGILARGQIGSLHLPISRHSSQRRMQIRVPLTVAGQRGIFTLFPTFKKPDYFRLFKHRVEQMPS